ncbi:exodeoxyribonuclease VII small subunit [Gallibacterium anatis]|uniref:Exodeoxyribonuclease 7 small subunit n=3 Tax=Gallibacterium anatis TaxID=750 RepID=F4H9P6_GALAU|nr:exodeoxyribonuclease VII small subunit [Gallibacterium anatis]AEC16060.1 exodeoxyribonuclease VII small subunit [Gallibacterium anatis UMN179]ERF78412.1 exodeoxyribonuclease VII small subunit [Gallibacterium anatis 12656/12]KGQ27169.1 exodeoxyribonuclease VII small subunit [Gallibacterium anatis]KGQ31583.1 exodeoxyribonuclease VII small subunit [Gallibacterium anatis]KGQ48431.1 exodeoxyribonuclease VII small subunit [Gallibacterium anatis]
MAKKTQPLNFENTLIELENVVNRLEQGDLPLEDALSQFEQGVNLAKQAQEKLANAEQRVQILLEKNSSTPLTDYPTSSLSEVKKDDEESDQDVF